MRPGRESDHISVQCRGKENVEVYLQLPNRFHGGVLNEAKGQIYVFISSSKYRTALNDSGLLNNELRKDAGGSAYNVIRDNSVRIFLEGQRKSQKTSSRISKKVKVKLSL
jgi:hypothetical protein